MEVLKEWNLKLKLVKTKTGSLLYLIELDKDHFFIEQNPFKKSKYGEAYRKLKQNFKEFYMLWEIKNNQYTGNLLVGSILRKEEIDSFIRKVAEDEEFMKYEDIKDEEEKEDIWKSINYNPLLED